MPALTLVLVVATVGLFIGFGPFAPGDVAPAARPLVGTTETPSPGTSPEPPSAPPTPTATDLVVAAHVEHLIRQTAASTDTWSVAVRGELGQAIIDHGVDQALMPASTLKSITAAVALDTFGPDHRFRTRVLEDGERRPDGTLVGNLVLLGDGDPSLGSPAFDTWYPARPRTHLEDLADQVVAAGIRRVFGRVVGIDPVLVGPALADGWQEHYLTDFDARRITGLTVDAGIRLTREGEVAVAAGEPGDGLVGSLSTDPRLAAARVFEALLLERGITFTAKALALPTPEDAERISAPVTPPPGARELGVVESPPLWRVLRFMVQHSDNQLADTIARVVAAEVAGRPDWGGITPSWGTALAGMGVDATGLVARDGSGLSRDNQVPASTLADIQARMARSEHAPYWAQMQAVAGQRGTLRTWLAGTPAVGRFVGKTGTLDDVKSVTGTVWGPDSHAFHLAVIVNSAGDSRWNVRAFMDQLVLTLAAALDGCVPLDEVRGLGAWATGACTAPVQAEDFVPKVPTGDPSDAASVAPPDVEPT